MQQRAVDCRGIARFVSSSCARCIGLRVWKATTFGRPIAASRARTSAGVRRRSRKSWCARASSPPRAGRSGCTAPSVAISATSGWRASVVPKTCRASAAASQRNFSSTAITATRSLRGARRAIQSPTATGASAATGSVIGIGNSVPSARRISSSTRSIVRLAHETIERRECAGREQFEIAHRTRRELDERPCRSRVPPTSSARCCPRPADQSMRRHTAQSM